ncbi:MAG TPA: hypothetical protein DCE18_00890 [Syntrophobacteraceae bacterium]|nr:hypothetical protein [Syntrophobacteraceae bacterium]
MAVIPSGPPRAMLVLCPAVTIWYCPLTVTDAEPLNMLTSMDPFRAAVMLAFPIRVISASLMMKLTPVPSGMVIINPSKGTWSHSICPRALEK